MLFRKKKMLKKQLGLPLIDNKSLLSKKMLNQCNINLTYFVHIGYLYTFADLKPRMTITYELHFIYPYAIYVGFAVRSSRYWNHKSAGNT